MIRFAFRFARRHPIGTTILSPFWVPVAVFPITIMMHACGGGHSRQAAIDEQHLTVGEGTAEAIQRHNLGRKRVTNLPVREEFR